MTRASDVVALASDHAGVELRRHNDANVAVFGARTMTSKDSARRLKAFVAEPFEGGRHGGRLETIRTL